ncbi:hypothetical protein [uncultured Shewanella sp.]|uniref:hypothetical protein n=1 Tax=uncultured Shewanella sp. TaxID=173975 RepID=UPI00261B7619|nr:hypothetical protein [uncultured Shewanella sp.]
MGFSVPSLSNINVDTDFINKLQTNNTITVGEKTFSINRNEDGTISLSKQGATKRNSFSAWLHGSGSTATKIENKINSELAKKDTEQTKINIAFNLVDKMFNGAPSPLTKLSPHKEAALTYVMHTAVRDQLYNMFGDSRFSVIRSNPTATKEHVMDTVAEHLMQNAQKYNLDLSGQNKEDIKAVMEQMYDVHNSELIDMANYQLGNELGQAPTDDELKIANQFSSKYLGNAFTDIKALVDKTLVDLEPNSKNNDIREQIKSDPTAPPLFSDVKLSDLQKVESEIQKRPSTVNQTTHTKETNNQEQTMQDVFRSRALSWATLDGMNI